MKETIGNIGDESLFIWENAINNKTTNTNWTENLKSKVQFTCK